MSLGENALYLLVSKFSEPPKEPPLDLVQLAINDCPECVHYKIPHKHHSTPLHWAARFGFPALARLLLQNGALPNCEDDEGKTPLHYAAIGGGHPGAAAQLLCRGAHVDSLSATSDTPLHLAAMFGSTGVAALLLIRGADPRKPCSDSFRPLHVAAFHGNGSVFALICMHGGSISDIASDSYTPVDLARIQGHSDIIKAALHDDGSEASAAIVLDVQKSIREAREALLSVAKETSTAALWILGCCAVLLIVLLAYGLHALLF